MARAHRATLVVTNYPPRVQGGAEINAQLLAEHLAQSGWAVTVLTGAATVPRTGDYRIISTPDLRPRPSLVYEPWWARRTAARLQAAGHLPDQGVTHAFDVLARAVVAAAGLRQTIATLQDVSPVCGSINRLWQNGQLCPGCSPERLIKHCLTTHEHRGLGRWARIVRYHTALPHRTQLLDHFTHLTTVSNFLKNFLELDRATVIPDLLIPPRPACRLERTTAPRIVAVGRLAFDKGTDLILRALADLPEFLAAFVGAGDLERWRSLAQALGVTDRTTFAGPVPAHEVGAWYHQADVVVLASRAPEASSRTILEGMSLGKPVVAPNCAGPAELVTEGSTGRLFPRGDATGLAHAIRRAHSERLTLGARARLASERYHPKRIGPRYCALYESLVS